MNYAMEAGSAIHIKAGMTSVIEAGMQLTLKVGGNFITISPVGVTIVGTLVMINSGGAAGSGAGSSPTSPDNPVEAKEADDDNAGSVDSPPPAPQSPTPVTYSAQATVLKKAAEDGTPFCAVCEAARRAQQAQ
jgi:type VI secretion system secreted protein VgrG